MLSTLQTKHVVPMTKELGIFRRVTRIFILQANFFAKTTFFLIFTLIPTLLQAICLSLQGAWNDFGILIRSRYCQRNSADAWSNLRMFLLSLMDSFLFHSIMISSRHVDRWSVTHDRLCRKMKNRTPDTQLIRRRICDFSVRTLLKITTTVIRIFADFLQIRFVPMRVNHSNIMYCLTWMVYNMIWRPPLAFIHLLNTLADELLFYLGLPDGSRAAKLRRRTILKQMWMHQEAIAKQHEKKLAGMKKLIEDLSNTVGVDLHMISHPDTQVPRKTHSESYQSVLSQLNNSLDQTIRLRNVLMT